MPANGAITAAKGQVSELQQELSYYKHQLDLLSGDSIRTQYRLAQQANQLAQLRNAFAVIVELQNSFSLFTPTEAVYEQFLELALQRLHFDKVALLQYHSPGKCCPLHLKGFGSSFPTGPATLDLPDSVSKGNIPLWVNGQTTPPPDCLPLLNWLGCPYLIVLPFGRSEERAFLVAGRMHERKPLTYAVINEADAFVFRSLSAILVSMQIRLEQHKEIEKERARIARDIHDDIGSELSRISMLSELLLRQQQADSGVLAAIEKIKASASEVVDNVGNIVWTLNPLHNNLPDLVMYLREFASDYLDLHDLQLTFTAAEMPPVVLGPLLRKNILLAVKETLRNIIKHARATSVDISLEASNDGLQLSIKDNGIGFTGKRHFGNGLRNIELRLAEIGGNTEVTTIRSKGTTVSFSVPVQASGKLSQAL